MKKGSFLDKLLSLIYPDTCPYCGEIISNSEVKCKECEKKIKYSFSLRKICDDVVCVSPFIYTGTVREAIHKFKFGGYKRYSWNFGMEMAKAIKFKFPNQKFSAVSYVPLYKKRVDERGFNQARCLAEEVGFLLNVPLKNLIEKNKSNISQHRIRSLKERIKNVEGVYESKCYCARQRHKIIICDDIITSGSTLKECVKVLKSAGFKDILCATIANTKRER